MQAQEKVIWHEGLLMAPQHMQLQARYHDDALHARIAVHMAHAWGVVALQLDTHALTQQSLSIVTAQVILPGGLYVNWDQDVGDAALRRSLVALGHSAQQTPMAADGSRRLEVYLGVARTREGLTNVATDELAQSHQRYRSHSRLVAEESFGQTPPVDVLLGVPHVQLLFTHELTHDIEAMPIAQLHLSADGVWTQDTRFAPPALRVHLYTHWLGRLQTLTRRLRGAADGLAPLAQMDKASQSAQAALRWSDVSSLMQLRALQTIIVLLEHVASDASMSPREAYLLLKQAWAAASALLPIPIPVLAPYQHTAPQLWLEDMMTNLETMAPSQRFETVRLPMQTSKRGHWHVALPAIAARDDARVLLEICAHHDARGTLARWTRQAKLTSPEALEHLLRAALAGIGLTTLTALPDGLHAKPDHIYLELDTSHAGWQQAADAQSLAVSAPQAADAPGDAHLLIVTAAGTRGAI